MLVQLHNTSISLSATNGSFVLFLSDLKLICRTIRLGTMLLLPISGAEVVIVAMKRSKNSGLVYLRALPDGMQTDIYLYYFGSSNKQFCCFLRTPIYLFPVCQEQNQE